MVYRRRRFVRRVRRARRPTAKRIARIARRTFIRNMEIKQQQPVILTSSHGSLGSTWTEVEPLSLIAAGTDVFHRIGRKIKLLSFYLDGVLVGGQSNLATDDNINTVRFVLGLWRSPTPCGSANLTISSVINKCGLSQTGGGWLVRKFRDFKVILAPTSPDSTGYLPAHRKIRIYVKFKRPITFTYSASTATSPDNLHFILSVISDSVAVPSPGFTSGAYYCRYIDA